MKVQVHHVPTLLKYPVLSDQESQPQNLNTLCSVFTGNVGATNYRAGSHGLTAGTSSGASITVALFTRSKNMNAESERDSIYHHSGKSKPVVDL